MSDNTTKHILAEDILVGRLQAGQRCALWIRTDQGLSPTSKKTILFNSPLDRKKIVVLDESMGFSYLMDKTQPHPNERPITEAIKKDKLLEDLCESIVEQLNNTLKEGNRSGNQEKFVLSENFSENSVNTLFSRLTRN